MSLSRDRILIARTTHSSTLRKKGRDRDSTCQLPGNSIFRVTLLASGFVFSFYKHRPEPEPVPAVTFSSLVVARAMHPVATRAAKSIGLWICRISYWDDSERTRQTIRLLARPVRRQIFGSQVERSRMPAWQTSQRSTILNS